MEETIKLVRVFLASPGDLQDERRLVNEAVEELNRGIAYHLGIRVELKGWEDTLSGSGRPQAIINQELDRCELFIGIMWKKWGTPPSLDGKYSSGFEEEFERSCLRLKDTGRPEMSMYFKDIGPLTVDHLQDLNKIGEDIVKVNNFKERLISEKEIYYENFNDDREFQKQVRLKITSYLINLREAEEESRDEKQSKTKNVEDINDKSQSSEPVKSILSTEGHIFLTNFLNKIESEEDTENITSFEIARFRLLASSISKSGNHEAFLGVHDANIIYVNKNNNFSQLEMSRLIDCGLKNFTHKNVPLWYWYTINIKQSEINFLPFKAMYYPDDGVSVGALEAMTLISLELPKDKNSLNRSTFITRWLSEDQTDKIKVSALRYLKYCGIDEDLPFIQSELDLANSQTSRISLEALINIQLRYDKDSSLELVFLNQFESFDETLLSKVLEVNSDPGVETLRLGLKHRNKIVRLESFRRLVYKEEINSDDIQDLKNDSFVQIRMEVVNYLKSINNLLTDKKVRSILVKARVSNGLRGLITSGTTDIEGRAFYDEYLLANYSDMSEVELLKIVERSSIYRTVPYFSLCSKYFKNNAELLRKDVDDKYKEKFNEHAELEKTSGISEAEIKKTLELEDFLRRQLTRKGLNILCRKGDMTDRDRIRNNMRSGYVNSTLCEIEYMGKMGEWEDIHLIINAEIDYTVKNTLTILQFDSSWHASVAKAAYKIGSHRLEELLDIEMSSSVLIELLKICSISKYSSLQDKSLYKLLSNKNDDIRKYATLKCIQAFNKTKLKGILLNYISSDEYRYYNVIFWLDFGVFMQKTVVNRAIKFIYNE